MIEQDKLPLEYSLNEALAKYVERFSLFLAVVFINIWVLVTAFVMLRLSIDAWVIALMTLMTYGIALGLWMKHFRQLSLPSFSHFRVFVREKFVARGINMEYLSLREQFLSIVQQLTQEQAWPLPPAGVQALVDAILPIASASATTDAGQIRLVALHYYADGPAVQAMLTPGSATGEQLWRDWQRKMLKTAQKKGLTTQDAEDLVQSVFLHTRHALQNFQFKSQLQTYFLGIFNRQYAKWLQRETRFSTTDLEENPEAPPSALMITDATVAVENAEIHQVVVQEIQKIVKSADYQILYWYYVEKVEIDNTTGVEQKWTDKTIGERLGMPINTVTARRLRALERLRQNNRLATLFRELLDRAHQDH